MKMAPKGNREKEKEKERRTVCVGCKKNFTKSAFVSSADHAATGIIRPVQG
jgi:hypothetical protein